MTIKILHLYHDLLNLYGEYANVAALERYFEKQSAQVAVDRLSLYDEVDFSAYDFIYLGAGTEEKQLIALDDLKKYKQGIVEAYERGTLILATGNSFEIFGKSITTPKGEKVDGIGILDMETTVTDKQRTLTDEICKAEFLDSECVGFINKASDTKSNEKPMFTVIFGAGNSKDDKKEGAVKNNFYGTHLTGPCLIKNPNLLKYFAALIAERKGIELQAIDLEYETKAYKITLDALRNRMK